uniref:Bardet-Biedl syndrome 1 N-terminal domain-containing protein n=1 Tax=Taeniopygia guttata TaxID=59729 RepID=A0A674HJL6_TAEGU
MAAFRQRGRGQTNLKAHWSTALVGGATRRASLPGGKSRRCRGNAMAAAEESSSLWLEAHEDPLAGLCSFPGCMALVDLHGDGDHKLVVGVPLDPGGPRLAVVRGAGSISSLALPEAPAGLGAFFGGPGGGPSVVVAAGSSLYVFRNLRPFFKFSLPPRPPEPLERDLWLQAEQDQIDPLTLKEMLEDLRWNFGNFGNFGGGIQISWGITPKIFGVFFYGGYLGVSGGSGMKIWVFGGEFLCP